LGAILNEKDAINVMLIILETAKDASSDIDDIKKSSSSSSDDDDNQHFVLSCFI
jgi:hypothetical protein